MDEMRRKILEAAQNKGIDLKELSLRIGKNHAYMQQFITRGSPKKLSEEDRAVVSQMLGIPEVELGAPIMNVDGTLRAGSLSAPSNATLTGARVIPGPMLPLYGTAVGGVDGQFELNGNLLDRVPAPAALLAVRNAYAVRVAGESMEPRYEDGETVFVDPTRRTVRGDYVIAQVRAEEHGLAFAYCKRFVRRNDKELVLEQFNPPKELRFDNKLVESVHYILKSGE